MIYFYKDNLNNPITIKDIPKDCWEFIVNSGFLKQVEKFAKLFSFSDYYKINVIISENLSIQGKTEYVVNLDLNNKRIGFITSEISLPINGFLIADIKKSYDFFNKLTKIARNSKK